MPVILADVNVLLYAFRADYRDHSRYRDWLQESVSGPEPFGISTLVLSAFIRIVTHPRIHIEPSPRDAAIEFTDRLLQQTASVTVSPGAEHWLIFIKLCNQSRAVGNLVADAYLAALAIESGSEWVTTDRDYSRFPRLRWRHPFDKSSRINPA